MIRKSTPDDIDLILRMYDHSRSVMRADGNLSQWVGYPTREDVEEDIQRGVSYITPLGTFALVPGIEPTYAYIDHGRWVTPDRPYSTLHRLAALPGTHGIADEAFRFAKQQSDYLRVDTHHDNRPMHHILEREGFVYCGVIYMPDGAPRDAYEWWRYDEVPEDLKAYVEHEILPRHEHYDAAHRPDHIRRVIARSMAMQPSAITYTAAAMHDLGLCEGRESHHLASGRIIRAGIGMVDGKAVDQPLRRWFNEAEIETIAQAAEDHRASAKTPPRSLLGCIIAEADRDIEPETIVRRTMEYGLSHYPELNKEGHWQRTLDHLHEKYAEGGYIKLWLPDSPNATPLAELRELIRDEKKLKTLFDNLWTSF